MIYIILSLICIVPPIWLLWGIYRIRKLFEYTCHNANLVFLNNAVAILNNQEARFEQIDIPDIQWYLIGFVFVWRRIDSFFSIPKGFRLVFSEKELLRISRLCPDFKSYEVRMLRRIK
jgi:hypothetical protein